MVSRWSRRRFLPWAWRAFALQTLAFGVWALVETDGVPPAFAEVFFVWLSVLNLFVVSVFWGFMADVWGPGAARRLYGKIALGGTAGALLGSLAGLGLRSIGDESFLPVLFLAAAILVEVAVRCALAASRAAPVASLTASAPEDAPVGGSAWDGIRRLFASPYLLGIAAYLLLHTAGNTVLYFARTHAVEGSGLSDAQTTDLFFWQEIAVQAVTLVIQLTGTSWLLATIGVGGALVLGPLLVERGP